MLNKFMKHFISTDNGVNPKNVLLTTIFYSLFYSTYDSISALNNGFSNVTLIKKSDITAAVSWNLPSKIFRRNVQIMKAEERKLNCLQNQNRGNGNKKRAAYGS